MPPGRCVVCSAPVDWRAGLCGPCRRDLPLVSSPCARCGLPLPDGGRCGRCLREPPPFEGCRIPFLYAFPVDRLIKRAKFDHDLGIARLLGRLLAEQLGDAPLPDRLIPVALHPRRLLQRGYNQAIEIARAVSQSTEVPLDLHALRRSRHTVPQTALPASLRRGNLRGAFLAPERLPYRSVAVIDDVVTTGSTVSEVARALKRASVAEVWVWACARTDGS